VNPFQVWAPKVKHVELVLRRAPGGAEESHPMQPDEHGWWSLELPEAAPGMDYGYRLDGDGPFPDPRSPSLPNGVHALGRLLDHSAYQWNDVDFQAKPLASGVIYEIHVGTFTPGGTFESAIERLDYLKDLGITHIEIMPVNQWSGPRNWGYDGVGLFAPAEAYGGPDGLKRFVDACHERGLAVILDVVYNHLGPEGNYLERFGPYHSSLLHTAWGAAINFDGPGSDEVRRFMIDNACMWLREYHIDGLRLDAIHAILDSSAVHLLEEMAAEVDRLEIELGRSLTLIAESDLNDPRIVRSIEAGGYGIDAQWSDDFHHALHVLLTGENNGYYTDFDGWEDLARTLTQIFAYGGRYSPHRDRSHGRPVDGIPAHRFLGYIQNHDQIGNRARGERIAQLTGVDLAKIGAAVVLTAPFVPMLFMGEEWAASAPFQYFSSHQDENLARAVSEGRRSEFAAFGWESDQVPDPQDEQTFLRSKLNWDELSQQPHAGMLDWYRQLIALRRSHPALKSGPLSEVAVSYDREDGWLLIARGPLLIACSLSEHALEIPIDISGEEPVLLASHPEARLTPAAVSLPPHAVLIAEIEQFKCFL
jgi:maltooligosyltrehalose trehalohydrolase